MNKKVKPIIDGVFEVRDNKVVEGLTAAKCKCGKISFPRKIICPYCKNQNVEEIKLSGKGKIYSFAISRISLEKIKAPYAIGYVDMEEGVRVFGQFKDWNEENLKIGREVEVLFEKFGETQEEEVWTYKFKIVN